jgi:glycosyltransferase involved in cell wall biosynthesis
MPRTTRQTSKVRRQITPPTALRIAIIVRTKDRPHLLTRSLQSLVEQKRQPNEVIVINDGGVAIDKIVKEFADLKIHLVNNQTNQGRSKAGNQGVLATDCDVIGFLDDDDRYLPDHLQRLEKAIGHFDAKVAYSGCRLLKRDLLGDTAVLQEQAIGQFNDAFDAQRLYYENYIPLINLLIDRQLWLNVGGFDESFDAFEDWDVLLRLSQKTHFYHVDCLTSEYAVWGNSQITQLQDQERWRNFYHQFLEKHLNALPDVKRLDYLAEYWRLSQERRGILQDTRLEKQDIQLQLIQSSQKLDQAQTQLRQSQAQTQKWQSDYAQLQSDWTNKYDKLQSDYTQLQTDWAAKYEKAQSQSAQQTAQVQSDWSAKHDKLQSDWTLKYEKLQTESAQKHTDWTTKYEKLQSDWTTKYDKLQSESVQKNAQLQSDWTTKYDKLQSESAQKITQMQSDWSAKYEKLQSDYTRLQTDWTAKYQQLQSENAKLQADWITKYQQSQSDSAKQYADLQKEWEKKANKQAAHVKQQQSEMQESFDKLEADYFALQKAALNEQQQFQSLQNTQHELSKQLVVGINQPALEKILQSSQPGTYAPASGSVIDDYYRLVEWIRQKAAQLTELESEAQSTNLSTQLGLNVTHQPVEDEQADIPPPRPLSDVYPTFISVAGTPEHPQIMEAIKEQGNSPFILDAGTALVFTAYCSADNFCRLDILFGTLLRINTCQMRVIIRDLKTQEPLRVLYFEAIEVFDNRFHHIHFEPISDSMGKTYQIEVDSPDATPQSCIAVWCHAKQPPVPLVETVTEPVLPQSPQNLPPWVQQSLLALPISAPLNHESAPHLFMIFGITEATPVINLHVLLGRFNYALRQAAASGQVIINGQFSQALKQYCQQHQITTVETSSTNVNLSHAINWTKTADSQADYLWCCEINALPQSDIIERTLEIFADCPNAGMLIPMEKQSDGRIRAGYASLMRDGILRTTSAGAPADHPYHGYRRTVDAASSSLVIMKIESITEPNLNEISAYRTPMYQLTELLWELKEKSVEAIYEAALCYEHDLPYPQFAEPDYNEDCRYFYQRWCDKLPTHSAVFTHLNELLNPQHLPTVLVIDATLPMYDEDSGSLRLYTLLKIWTSLGYRITFFPDNLDSQFKYRHALEALGIEVFHSGYGFADAMAYRQFDFAFICRVDIGQRYIPYVRLLSPQTVIFYDTVDIHYIREQRQAEIENNAALAAHAVTTKRKELANCLLSDRVITVTEDDGHHLQQELPNIAFSVIPNIHQQQPLAETGFDDRDGLVFIGNYNHLPNEDAVYYLVENVLPKIHAQLPNVCLYLIGSNMKDNMKALASEHVKVVGWVDKVEPEFAKRRVFVSYLRYGAGMKGKLGQALSVGLPVVTTKIGAEGMGLIEAETALIADEPEQFAEAVCRLYTDSQLWQKLSLQGKEYIEQRYGETAVREQLKQLLS